MDLIFEVTLWLLAIVGPFALLAWAADVLERKLEESRD